MPKLVKEYTADGFTGTLSDFSKHFNIPYSLLYNRVIVCHMSMHEALHKDLPYYARRNPYLVYNVNGLSGSLADLAKRYDLVYQTLLSKVNKTDKSNKEVERIVNLMVKEKKTKISKVKKQAKINKMRRVNKYTNEEIDQNPILSICIKEHKDYDIVIKRVTREGFTLEEAMNIPLENVNTKNLIYRNEIGSMQLLCKRFKADFIDVYDMVKNLYDFEYAMDYAIENKIKEVCDE